MVGRTKLIRTTGSPLIGGWTRRKRALLPVVIGVLIALVLVAAGVWYFFLR